MKQLLLSVLVVLLFLSEVTCRKSQQPLAQQKETVAQRKTVVESNHFSSNYQKNTSYLINAIQANKPLVFVLKDPTHSNDDSKLIDNPITITITSGAQNKVCQFKSYQQLCALENVIAQEMNMKIQCLKTPCELSWLIVQPAKKEADGDQQLNHLVSINKDNNHASLKVKCVNPQLQDKFASSLLLYSSNKFQKILSNKGIARFLFNNQEQGFYFLTTQDPKMLTCAKATLTHAEEKVPFNDVNFLQHDFVSKDYPVTYEFKTLPEGDFRIDFSAHDIMFENLSNDTSLNLTLNGLKNNQKTVISNLTLQIDEEKTFLDFSLVFKKLTAKYDSIELEITSVGSILEFQAKFYANDLHEVQLGEESFFYLHKGDKLKYKLVPAKEDKNLQTNVTIFGNPTDRLKLSLNQCNVTIGCEFQVQALQDGAGNIYIGQSKVQNKKQTIIVPFVENSIKKFMREGQYAFFSHSIKLDDTFQLIVNTPNVIVYCASKDKCSTLDADKCYEKVFTYHHPSFYEATKDDELVFKVFALDNAEMTLTILDQNTKYVQLKDNVPFAYLFDDQETSLTFKFKVPKKEDVSFNLIAPNNQLNLLVLNQEDPKKSEIDKADWASDGYIKFQGKQLQSTSFFIQVKKRQNFVKNYIHFTLIASTSQTNLRLQPGITHYQNLNPKEKRYFVFQFIQDKKVFINFYNHNLKSKINVQMKISNSEQYDSTQANQTATFTIDQEIDVLDIDLVAQKLCQQDEQNCELFIQLQNKMDIQVDISLTLMIQQSIIEIKDGIWQSFDINTVSITSHFYFIPNHPDHSTTIFYKSTIVDLKIMYLLWKSDDKSIDPSSWPFPLEFKENQTISQVNFKPLHYIHIEPAMLKTCWPDCIVLLSIAPDNQTFKSQNYTTLNLMNQYFRIMASNTFIQLPEKHTTDIVLTKNQTKQFLIDLKYHQDKEHIAFQIYFTLGSSYLTTFKVNVYSEKNPRCPTVEESSDFSLSNLETVITMEDIKSKLSENSIQASEAYLCVFARSSQNTKFTIEWTSQKDDIKNIAIDTSVTLVSSGKQVHIYQISPHQETYLKIIRTQGFPYAKIMTCDPLKKEISKCIDYFVDNEQKGLQLADKVTTFQNLQACQNCVVFLKITSEQASKINIHVQSKYAEVQLSEKNALADSLSGDEQNRYSLTGSNDKEININIQIISGNVQVEIHDFDDINIKKSNQKTSKNINIIIPPKDLKKKKKQLSSSYMSEFALSNFIHLHIIVSTTDKKVGAQYIITYTSGDTIIFLQDGLISEYNILPKKPTKFIFDNPVTTSNSRGIYLHTSTTNADELNKLNVKIYGLDDPEDQDGKVQMTPQKMNYNKKTVNPTMLVKLPYKKSYIFQVENNNDKSVLYTLGINNVQVMYLPFDHQLPLQLKQGQFIYVVVSASSTGYVKLSVKKCDQTQLEIAYTLDYKEFVNEQFQNQQDLTDELSTELIIKTKGQGNLYIKLTNAQFSNSVATIQATFSPSKIIQSKAKPGDKGLIQYQLLDSTKAELTFTSIVCNSNDKNCNKDFNYVAISAEDADEIYAQLVCPAIMFDLPEVQHLKAPTITNISSTAKNNKLTFTLPIHNESQFVGIKATNSKSGEIVYYRPIEILTFWGQIHKSNKNGLILWILGFVFICTGMLIYRRYKKNKEANYESLKEVNDQI